MGRFYSDGAGLDAEVVRALLVTGTKHLLLPRCLRGSVRN
jgi:hypothetical protein